MISLLKPEALANSIIDKVDRASKLSLQKSALSLSKTIISLSEDNNFDFSQIKAQVVCVLDHSVSMPQLYEDGTVQNTLNRLIPMGLLFDANGSIETYTFSSDYTHLSELNVHNYKEYVINNMRSIPWGGTCYAEVIHDICFGHKKFLLFWKEGSIVNDHIPTYVLFITDGDNSDTDETTALIRKISEMNVFIQFIGIGNAQFQYLTHLDSLPNRPIDNTGFTKIQSLRNISNEDFYRAALDEFSLWVKFHGQYG